MPWLRMHTVKEAHFFFWFKIISESMDLILDWGFIHKMNHITDPHVEQSSNHHILGFAMWGTMLYVLTIISLLRNSRNGVDDEHPCFFFAVNCHRGPTTNPFRYQCCFQYEAFDIRYSNPEGYLRIYRTYYTNK